QVCALEAGEIDVGTRERNAGRLLVLGESRRVNLLNFVEIFLKSAWVVGSVAQHLRQIDIVERKHFADDIENAVGQNRAHLFKFFEESCEDSSFNDVLPFPGLRRDEIEGVTVALLPDAMDTA